MNSQMKEETIRVKKIFDLLGVRYIDFRDKKIINFVSKMLNTINTGAYVSVGTIDYQTAISISLENLKVLGLEPYVKVSSFISKIPLYPIHPIKYGFSCYVSYSVDDKTMEVDRESGTVVNYKVPQTPDVMAPFFLAHEHIHALKETYYNEYIDDHVFGDVIPMFYELLMCDKHEELKMQILKFRLNSLKEDKKHYDNAIAQMRKKDNKDLYKVIATRSGQYLNSFYYSLLLYNLYRSEPKMILELVNKVLNHELTTREMLEKLGLLYSDNNEIFEEELGKIRKVFK